MYSSTINNVLFTAEGRQMSEFEPSLACFCVFFVFFFALFFWVGERVHGCLSIVLFTAAVGLQMSGFEPSLVCFCAVVSRCFPFVFLWVGEGG